MYALYHQLTYLRLQTKVKYGDFVRFIKPTKYIIIIEISSVDLKVVGNFICRQVKQVSFKHILSCQ